MNLLLIEDEHKTADSLKKGLEESGFEVDVAYDGIAGLERIKNKAYHLVVSDIIMPGLNGLDLCKKIRAINPDLPVLLLTALESKDDIVTGFDAGADDYLTKPFDFRELVARIKSLVKRRGIKGVQPQIQYADITIYLNEKKASRNGESIVLTAKEYKLLEYFMQRPEKVISRAELARDIWNVDFDTGTNIVEVYINYLRNKIDKPFKKRLLQNVHGMGYILKDGGA